MSFRSLACAGAVALSAAPAFAAAPQPTGKVELTGMAGRWYEVARLPNRTQKGCQGGTSDWSRSGDGFAVVQVCHKGSLNAPATEWKAKARVVNPGTNNKFKMSFFGGLVNQEYWVLDHRPDQGWIILGTPGGNFLWLMATRPNLTAAFKAQAVARIRQLGYDASRLEFPQPAVN